MSVTIEHSVSSWTKRESTILSMVVARCWRDADYRAALQADPRAVFAAEGLHVPAGLELRVVESLDGPGALENDLAQFVVIPPRPADLDPTAPEYDLVRRAAVARSGALDPQGSLWVEVITASTTSANASASIGAEIVVGGEATALIA
jgi:hypothetical protein